MKSISHFLKRHSIAAASGLLIVLLICLVFVLVLFRPQTAEPSSLPEAQPVNAQSSEAQAGRTPLSGDSTVLLVFADDSGSRTVLFLALLNFQIYSERLVLTPLALDTSVNGVTYQEGYRYGGINMLLSSVEELRQCQIDRYVILNRDGFCDIADRMGKVTVTVEEDYTYFSSDKSYKVSVGENELEAAMLYTYFKINAEKNDVSRAAALLCLIINTYLKAVKMEEAQSLFGDLCNCVKTDITISDYFSASADIQYLLAHHASCVVSDAV